MCGSVHYLVQQRRQTVRETNKTPISIRSVTTTSPMASEPTEEATPLTRADIPDLIRRLAAAMQAAATKTPTDTGEGSASSTQPGELPVQLICIQAGEFVDMWLQFYSIYTPVLAAKHPKRTQDMMGNQVLIMEVRMEYKGDRWLGYDRRFRQRAAATPDTVWARIDPTLWKIDFARKARAAHCKYCFSLPNLNHKPPPTVQGFSPPTVDSERNISRCVGSSILGMGMLGQ